LQKAFLCLHSWMNQFPIIIQFPSLSTLLVGFVIVQTS
jgi:hypothetical protein